MLIILKKLIETYITADTLHIITLVLVHHQFNTMEFTECRNVHISNHQNMRGQRTQKKSWSHIQASNTALKTFNPIRNILETMTLTPNPEKKMISLSIGEFY